MKRKTLFALFIIVMMLSACRSKISDESTSQGSLVVEESESSIAQTENTSESSSAPKTNTITDETSETDEISILENNGEIVIEHPDDMDDDGF